MKVYNHAVARLLTNYENKYECDDTTFEKLENLFWAFLNDPKSTKISQFLVVEDLMHCKEYDEISEELSNIKKKVSPEAVRKRSERFLRKFDQFINDKFGKGSCKISK